MVMNLLSLLPIPVFHRENLDKKHSQIQKDTEGAWCGVIELEQSFDRSHLMELTV